MSKIYGNPPIDLGLVDLCPEEMLFWLYCPIKVPGGALVIPPNLEKFRPIVSAVLSHMVGDEQDAHKWQSSYVYLTAKTLFVTADNPGNRPGWHSDGFMTDDLNFIWYDGNPTLFWEPFRLVNFTPDDKASMREMEAIAEINPRFHQTHPNKHLLRLDETVIHRVADVDTPRVRTFVKVSISRDKYNLVGNSINHGLDLGWDYVARAEERNQPAPEGSAA
jgi:hypothetical protein